jgi:hypothetical protein
MLNFIKLCQEDDPLRRSTRALLYTSKTEFKDCANFKAEPSWQVSLRGSSVYMREA